MKRFKSKSSWNRFYLWGNLLAMAVAVVLLLCGIKYGLALYTHHGEAIEIPDLKNKDFADAEHIANNLGLVVVASDTGYVRTLQPDCVLEQSPAPGEKVKSGRVIYVTVNAMNSPTIALPDVIDNSSLREAMAKLSAMGFKLGEPKFVPGEQDWVYGILVRGKNVVTGDRISVEDKLVIQVGNGLRDETEEVRMVAPQYDEFPSEDEGEVDEFEEITLPEEQIHPEE